MGVDFFYYLTDLHYRLIKSVPSVVEDKNDAANELLYTLFVDHLCDLHDGHEVQLTEHDHETLPGALSGRHKSGHFARYFVCELSLFAAEVAPYSRQQLVFQRQ